MKWDTGTSIFYVQTEGAGEGGLTPKSRQWYWYRARLKGFEQVWWILMLLLLTTSARACLQAFSQLDQSLLADPYSLYECQVQWMGQWQGGRRSTIPKILRTWLALFAAQPFSRVATASPFTRIMNVILTDIDILSVARGRPNFPGNPFICHYVVHYQGYLWRMLKLTVDRQVIVCYLPSGARNHYIFTSSVIAQRELTAQFPNL